MGPIHVLKRIRTVRNLGSRNERTALWLGGISPSKMRVGRGWTRQFPDYYIVYWVFREDT